MELAAWNEAIAFFEQALAQSGPAGDPVQRQTILSLLGHVCLEAGQFARAAEVSRQALDLAKTNDRHDDEGTLYLNLAEAFLLENRFDALLDLAEEIGADNRPQYASNAATFRGLVRAHGYADPAGAIEYLREAETLLCEAAATTLFNQEEGLIARGQIKFELGNNFARLGDLPTAVQYYREGLEITQNLDDNLILRRHILLYNNLAYHLHLLGDPTAIDYAQKGIALAQEKGLLSVQPYFWSTLGEIALAQNDLDTAEHDFTEGLTLARQFSSTERVAGLTANLGLVARRRGQHDLAVELLSDALAQAEALNISYLLTQIRLWLSPLLPPTEARAQLAAARAVAEQAGYNLLLAQADRLKAEIQE
jgi:tetratricopeptide (TPR) repeat protein